MINVGIVGISGYSGKMLLKILLGHPEVRVTYVAASTTTGKVSEIHSEFSGQTKLFCKKYNLSDAKKACDLVFVAVPHTKAMGSVKGLVSIGKPVIDLSADYRFDKISDYKKGYGVAHSDKKNLKKAVYGLPELYREDIKKARLVANPGCYPTAAILALAPLVAIYPKQIDSITIDAKSGISGAGRKAAVNLLYSELNENMKAYKVLKHQHAPEIDKYLSHLAQKDIATTFVPHLVPLNQGILETIYVTLKNPMALSKVHQLYKKFYKTEKFVRVLKAGDQPEIKCVTNTNYCDIGLACAGTTLVITAVIDNLVKGAAGQAVQNMNIMCDFPETEGLI